MIFWSIAIAVTAIACAALFYAATGRTVNATADELAPSTDHFRLALAGIEADERNGKLDADQAVAAKGELAREMLRSQSEAPPEMSRSFGRGPLLGGLLLIAAISFGAYAYLGTPDLPAQPLAQRPEFVAQSMDMDEAVARIEARLAETPDDLRGWQVIAPVYMDMGRYGDAVAAYRRILALSEKDPAQAEADLAQALLLEANGTGSDEAMQLLRSAISKNSSDIRSRLYLAAELMRAGQYADAAPVWQDAINLAKGDEAWLGAARQGLAAAQNDGVDPGAQQQSELIQGMVGGLAERLYANGGTIEEWTRLVRSYLVLDDPENAQRALDAAVAAYPTAFERGDLDTLALGAGLRLNGDKP